MQKQNFRLQNKCVSKFLFPFASTSLVLLFLFVVFPLVPEIELASAAIDSTIYGLTLTTSPSINLSIQPTSAGAVSIAKDTVVANTNSPSGYKLYLSVNKDLDNNIYLDGDTANNTINTKFTPTAGTYETPSALSQNSWGYAVADLNSFDASYNIAAPSLSSKFANIPMLGEEQLIHDHSGIATDDATDIYYGVKANINVASGNYFTELLYTTLSDVSSEVAGEATTDTGELEENYQTTNTTITTSLMTDKDLGAVSAMIGDIVCENIKIISTKPVTIKCVIPAGLATGTYDIAVNFPGIGKSYTITDAITVKQNLKLMQDIAYWMDDLELEQQVQAIDSRDNKIYWVAKLKDGNVWMTQNLDYDIKETENIISSDGGILSTWSPDTATSTSISGITSDDNIYSYDPGNIGLVDGSSYTSVNCNTSSNSGENCHYHIGNYYQWNAAIATTSSGSILTTTDTTNSICPKGWRLPTGGNYTDSYSFGKLTNAYNITNSADGASDSVLLSSPLYFVRGGNINDGVNSDSGVSGYYWSSSKYLLSKSYSLQFKTSKVDPSNAQYRDYGSSVRCVAIDPFRDLYTMQDIANWKNSLEVEQQVQAIDNRDNKVYWVAKLKDGNIWMTQNLDYDIKATGNIISNNSGTTSTWSPNTVTGTSVFDASNNLGTYSYDSGNIGYKKTTQIENVKCEVFANSKANCHYHLGNYYQWNAATAGTGGTITSKNATSSICPKGWRLPTSSNYTDNYSFGKLTNAYGITNNENGTSDSSMTISPLYFVYGGWIDNSILGQGGLGTYWSSTATGDTTSTYYLNFNGTGVRPNNIFNRGYGTTVRCVAI